MLLRVLPHDYTKVFLPEPLLQIYRTHSANMAQRFVAILVRCLALAFSVLLMTSCAESPQVTNQIHLKPEINNELKPARPLTNKERWQQFVWENRDTSIGQKLEGVNEFFNQFEFIDDRYLWDREDYWATLDETLAKGAGDCEDFTIAKYFTLRELNIPGEDMRLTYVISLKTRKPHMVLTIALDHSREPLVLDTMNNYLFKVSRRPDLVPVYSFNEQGYWLAKKKDYWRGESLGNPRKLSLWESVLIRTKIAKMSGSKS